MKCPNCSFNNIAKAEKCKICGTQLDILEGENTDTLSLDEALKAIFAGKAKASKLADDADDDASYGAGSLGSSVPEGETPPAWEPLSEEAESNASLSADQDGDDPFISESICEDLPSRASDIPRSSDSGEDSLDAAGAGDFIDLSGCNPDTQSFEAEKPQKINFVPVFEVSDDHSINMEDDAENLLSLSMNDDIEVFAPEKRRASKMDEIAGIAVILLILTLIALIFIAIKMGKPGQPAPIVITTTSSGTATTEATISTTTTTAATTTTSSSKTTSTSTAKTSETSTTPEVTPFDEWYFVKSGSVSNGDGTAEDVLTKIRMGDHHYFHRLVFDFTGYNIPTYTVSILDGGYLVQLHVENITDYTSDTAVAEWSNIAETIEISADTSNSINIDIRMSEPVMISTYGLEEPGRIIIDIRGESNKD